MREDTKGMNPRYLSPPEFQEKVIGLIIGGHFIMHDMYAEIENLKKALNKLQKQLSKKKK